MRRERENGRKGNLVKELIRKYFTERFLKYIADKHQDLDSKCPKMNLKLNKRLVIISKLQRFPENLKIFH